MCMQLKTATRGISMKGTTPTRTAVPYAIRQSVMIILISGNSASMIDFNIWPHLEKVHSVHTRGVNNMMGDYKTK